MGSCTALHRVGPCEDDDDDDPGTGGGNDGTGGGRWKPTWGGGGEGGTGNENDNATATMTEIEKAEDVTMTGNKIVITPAAEADMDVVPGHEDLDILLVFIGG